MKFWLHASYSQLEAQPQVHTKHSFISISHFVPDKMASLGTLKRLLTAQSVRRMTTSAAKSDFKKHLLEEENHSASKNSFILF